MSIVFWALLILAVAFTGGFIYSMTAAVRAYKRGEHLDNHPIKHDFDLDFFYGRWMCICWTLTFIWALGEVTFRYVS